MALRLFEGDRGKRIAFWLFAVALGVFHLALTSYFVSLPRAFSAQPITGDDFDTHIAQCYRVLEGVTRFGHSWVYDVKLLAGQPEGAIFDADNKGWELWTIALHSIGVPKGMAFNLFVLLATFGCPLLVYRAARLFDIRPRASLFAAFLASLLWFFDSFNHWAWWVGMVSYAFAGFFVLWPLAGFYRFARDRSLHHAIGTALVLGIAHTLHPYSFFVLAPGIGAIYLAHARSFGRREHLWVVAIAACTIAMNAWWLHAAIIHWHYIQDSAYFGQTGLAYLLADFMGILINPSDSGVIGTRAAFRFFALALAVAALVGWRRDKDPRFAVFATTLGVCLALSYLAKYVPHAGQVQPYRHVVPLGFLAAVAGASFVDELLVTRALAGLPRTALAALAVTSLIAFEQLCRDALYFMPDLAKPVAPLIDGSPSPISEHGFGRFHPKAGHVTYGLPRGPLFEVGSRRIVQWIERNIPMGERVLVDNPSFGERLAWRGRVEVLGGFRERNIAHAYANFFRAFPKPVKEEKVAQYLKTYAVGWVVLFGPRADLEDSPLLEEAADMGSIRVLRAKQKPSKLLRGSGLIKASTNRIEVRGTHPGEDLLLSYHFHEALRCAPRCKVEREDVASDRVGFIRVRAPHEADLVIWNAYP